MNELKTVDSEPVSEFAFEIASDASNYDINEFIKGQDDCKNGIIHESGKSESYNAGYSAQYQIEQILSNRTDFRGIA
jgi:hypothetical protein